MVKMEWTMTRDSRLMGLEALARRRGGGCWRSTWAFEWTPDSEGRGPLEEGYQA